MIQLQPALMRRPRVMGILVVSLMLMIGCDHAGPKGSTSSGFFGARIDTITVRDSVTVRDTIVVVDTVLVEREVVKKIEVPPEIPAHYEKAWKRQVAELRADFANDKTCFSGLDSMKVSVEMNENAQDILSSQRAKDKFELTLRRHGVPLSDSSNPYLVLQVQAVWDEDKALLFYTRVSLMESLIFYRNNKPHRNFVNLWENSGYGYVGKNVARETFLETIEARAERVANLYLSAN